ncbi:MAG: membrane or secreted protein [Chitinophagales bacterium]
MKHFSLLLLLISSFNIFILQAQQPNTSPTKRGVVIDDSGVMKWADTQEEIQGFGVNYTTPFAHAYRSALKLGVNPLEAIDEDVYHFSRLGFDLYRVHVWDTEISDTLGNLLFNEHLNAFDYLLKKLGERNINYVITPIAFWGNGWPEPDDKTPGFSAKYGKDKCLTNPDAIAAQQNYLYQFMNHVNPYTQVAYKNDPRLIAIEISNEPHHREAPEKVTKFVKGMVESVRKTGYEKPIFYNISHSVHLADDYFKADIQGGTFQWYPTGLGYQEELQGNFLPNVDKYDIPFEATIKKHKAAKLVYEFDAADIGKSYIYPAMARSFRTTGIQIATHFAYDPTYLAYANTEYNTHHMNLAYTPDKALSLKICSEVFHHIPMYKDFGAYPQNAEFDDFLVNYEQNLAMFNTNEKYFHTNSTSIAPKNSAKLQHLAGHGSSPIVEYSGTGAYFLDKLEKGVWRLEVMPDALIIRNPYGRNSLDKKVAVIQWNENQINIKLNDLGMDFNIHPLNDGNSFKTQTKNGLFTITPGSYLLTKAGINSKWKASDNWQNIRLGEFHAPKSTVDKIYLVHEPFASTTANEDLKITAQVISPNPNFKVQLQLTSGLDWKLIEMERKEGFKYVATIPKNQTKQGFLTYYLYVKSSDENTTFPAAKTGFPYDWDFYERTPYSVRVIKKEQPIYLFDAQEDWTKLSLSWWSRDSQLIPTNQAHEAEYQIRINELFQKDEENLNATPIYDYSIKYYINRKVNHLRTQLTEKKVLVLKARSLDAEPKPIQISLTTKDGRAYGKVVELGTTLQEYEIPIAALKEVKTITMPRPYPTFLPYYFEADATTQHQLNMADIEGIQISIGPDIEENQRMKAHGVGIVGVMLR